MIKYLFLILCSYNLSAFALPCKRAFEHNRDDVLYREDIVKRDSAWKKYKKTAKKHYDKRNKERKKQVLNRRRFNRRMQRMLDSVKDTLYIKTD